MIEERKKEIEESVKFQRDFTKESRKKETLWKLFQCIKHIVWDKKILRMANVICSNRNYILKTWPNKKEWSRLEAREMKLLRSTAGEIRRIELRMSVLEKRWE